MSRPCEEKLIRFGGKSGGGRMNCELAPQVSTASPRNILTFVGLVLLFPTMCGTSPTHTPFVLASILKDALGATFSAGGGGGVRCER